MKKKNRLRERAKNTPMMEMEREEGSGEKMMEEEGPDTAHRRGALEQ